MIISIRKRKTVMMKVHFREVLFSLFEGTSAKIPLALPEKNPLASRPLWF